MQNKFMNKLLILSNKKDDIYFLLIIKLHFID